MAGRIIYAPRMAKKKNICRTQLALPSNDNISNKQARPLASTHGISPETCAAKAQGAVRLSTNKTVQARSMSLLRHDRRLIDSGKERCLPYHVPRLDVEKEGREHAHGLLTRQVPAFHKLGKPMVKLRL